MNWEALAAIGTIFSAITALGIAMFSHLQSAKRERRSREKEAIEKILTPIRKELHDLSRSKWSAWYHGNRWDTLETLRLDFPLQYFWLNRKIKKRLDDFDSQWFQFEYLSHQERENFKKLIAGTSRQFFAENKISFEIIGEENLSDEAINNIHWSCTIGGKSSAAVTIHSLVLWSSSLSAYIEGRRREKDIPNTQVDNVEFSIHSPSSTIKVNPAPTLKQSDELLSKIEEEIRKYPKIEEYKKKWQELYNNGFNLIREIDSWLSEDEFIEIKQGKMANTKIFTVQIVYKLSRLLLVLFFIFGSSLFITQKLTPPDYTILFKRECDGIQCQKIKAIDSERNTSIENDIEALSSSLERFDFFARFTFLRFDFQTANQSQFILAVTEPRYEKGIDIIMQCNLNGQDYVFSPNSGIIFKQKSSLGNIIKELSKIQDLLINCNPAPQDIKFVPTEQIVVAPNAQVRFIYNEEKYHLRFLPDKWNYLLTALQMFIIVGIFLGVYYEITRFIKKGLKN